MQKTITTLGNFIKLEMGKPAVLNTPNGVLATDAVSSFTEMKEYTRFETAVATYIVYPWIRNEYLKDHEFAYSLRKAFLNEAPAGTWEMLGYYDRKEKQYFCSSVKSTLLAPDALIREMHGVADEILCELNTNVPYTDFALEDFCNQHCKVSHDYVVGPGALYSGHVAFLEKERGFYILTFSWRTDRFKLTAFPKELAEMYANLYVKAQREDS